MAERPGGQEDHIHCHESRQMRTKKGASIVGIEREGESIINPGVTEELRGGDAVLLPGTEAQIEPARTLLR